MPSQPTHVSANHGAASNHDNPGLSTHVLDTASGKPAVGVTVTCARQHGEQWQQVGSGITDSDGRIKSILDTGALHSGHYRLTFDTGAYFSGASITTFFPKVSVEFIVSEAARHHHVPLLLSPFGYSTYQGS